MTDFLKEVLQLNYEKVLRQILTDYLGREATQEDGSLVTTIFHPNHDDKVFLEIEGKKAGYIKTTFKGSQCLIQYFPEQ